MPTNSDAGRPDGLTVAVTGPTGAVGRAAIAALERADEVGRIVGLSRRGGDAAAHGWTKTELRRGDVADPDAVRALVAGADVVLHLAFVIMAGDDDGERTNVGGSRTVFDEAVAAGVGRIVHVSSITAYGSPPGGGLVDEQQPLHQPGPGRPYAAHKVEAERELEVHVEGTETEAYVIRPALVAGPSAHLVIRSLPYVRLGERLPSAMLSLLDQVPILKPVLPDPGAAFQLVHHDDLAEALVAAVLGRGAPGAYNVAGPGTFSVRDLASALGWYTVPLPELAADAVAEIADRLPFLPPEAQWVDAARRPVHVDATKARHELGWEPRHDAVETIEATVRAHRADLTAGVDV
ncbi:NAD-dependent epimerase/dehydratase family protein [Patulibacter defluvii]|uniref:NAD-dependent epimerase/dehydratase family protein n=1 Tax=Patulibacter defluvii TaxID=3095358 RepID=UPI002A74EED9|nr:NAD-dependent epimerase/dehydratase family protein [Patulibacter sp. DM4]